MDEFDSLRDIFALQTLQLLVHVPLLENPASITETELANDLAGAVSGWINVAR